MLEGKGFEAAVDEAFEDDVLTEEEESNLQAFIKHFHFEQDDLDEQGAYTKIVTGAVLRSILNGDIPERVSVEGDLPFNFQKNEKLVWVFPVANYYEERTQRQYVGGHAGVSVRVAKGLYFRTGSFQGRPVEQTETVFVDSGMLGVTDKHIYFAGDSKRFRIKHDKVVAFEPFEDGISLQRDAATAKPQSFETGDGWFTYNLITNLAKL